MSRWATEVAILKEMVEVFDDFILADRLYRTLLVHTAEGDRQPTMSAGRFLMSIRHLEHERQKLTHEERSALDSAQSRLETIRIHLSARYLDKLLHELRGQVSSWRWFLDDCLSGSGGCEEIYPGDVRSRVRIELLLEELEQLGAESVNETRIQVATQDSRLRAIWLPGPFIWQDENPSAYPEKEFWFLYGLPHPRD